VATTVKELRGWLETLAEDELVGVDEAGFSLEAQGQVEPLEVGWLPGAEPKDDQWFGVTYGGEES
jgi:hypothetical protein